MNCRDVRPLLARYVDGDTDGYEQTLLEEHLSACPHCTAEIAQLRLMRHRVQREIKRWAASAVPPARAWDRLMMKLTIEKETPAQAAMPLKRSNKPFNKTVREGESLYRRIALVGLLLIVIVIAAFLVLLLRSTP